MIKFFKELVSSFKEGIAEAKEEIATEATEIKNSKKNDKERIEKIGYIESFGTALGAPFRIIIFGDWFTLFNNSDDDDSYPIHLYTFGAYPKLEDHKKDFTKFLKRDFGIIDNESCVVTLSTFFRIGVISTDETILKNVAVTENIDAKMWDMNKNGSKAVLAVVLSHIISASTDVGFLQKTDALDLMKSIIFFVKEHYSDWDSYAYDFAIGESNIGLNNKIGKSYLTKYLGYLKDKKGSPRKNIIWST
ncbi:hypothetical protein GCM10022393_38030 [Aquimarina addita]|uniref:DUF1266 domain-containing protein n=1 Tax=Aquimarina addita TaxID=870485 RepID=A0ABP6UUX5_9FLAO